MAAVVENRLTPKWVALVNGSMDEKICGPSPGLSFDPNVSSSAGEAGHLLPGASAFGLGGGRWM